MGLRTGDEYRESIRDGRVVYYDGELVDDVTQHPAFKPIIDVRARMYDMQFEDQFKEVLTFERGNGTRACRAFKPPRAQEDLVAQRRYVETVLNEVAGVVQRVGDDTVCELWSMHDNIEMLRGFNPLFAENVESHIERLMDLDLFHVSGNTDPKGDRSRPPQEQDPDMLLHVVDERDDGIVVRGAKYETAACYANQGFIKPTIGQWDEAMKDYAVGFITPMNAKGLKLICRTALAVGKDPRDYPIATKFDEIDTLLIFDDVLVPWENVLFSRIPEVAAHIRGTLHRYMVFPFLLRTLFRADMLLGTAFLNIEQTGLEKVPQVREKLTTLMCYRETINAHLQASIYSAQTSPGGLCMPNQPIMYAGRVFASTNLPTMVAHVRELAGGQVQLTPDTASWNNPEVRKYLEKYYAIRDWGMEDRIKLLLFTRDLVDSSMAGHNLSFQLFAQSPPYANLVAMFNSFDPTPMKKLVRKAADLSDVMLKEG
ncbi:MAG: 4-hydroxyphenylacetate 3-hydroxylase family protein [Chloroflexi bacterium]|nr:4-hydroxyphenylacetate 3-hydroxylase family protein [Chloroflexota bacterium]